MKLDTLVLVHDCYNPKGKQKKARRCGCKTHISQAEAKDLVHRRRAIYLPITRYGRLERKHTSIVMRVNQRQKLPAILQAAKASSVNKNIAKTKHGKSFHLDLKRTDKLYWDTVMSQIGLGVPTGLILDDADQGKGRLLSLKGYEDVPIAPVKWNQDGETQWVDGQHIDPDVEEIILQTIDRTAHLHEHKGKVRCNGEVQHRGRGADTMEINLDDDEADISSEKTFPPATVKPYSDKNVPAVRRALAADDPAALKNYENYLLELGVALEHWEIDLKEPKEPEEIAEEAEERANQRTINYDDTGEEIEDPARPTQMDKMT